MRLEIKLFLLMFIGPALTLVCFWYFMFQTFLEYRTADVLESQVHLLNSTGLFLAKTEAAELPAKMKVVLSVTGMENLVVSDRSGTIRFSNNSALVNHTLLESFGQDVADRLKPEAGHEGWFEAKSNKGNVLMSFVTADLVYDQLTLTLFKSRAAVLRPTLLFAYKTIASLLALLGVFLFSTSFFSARWLGSSEKPEKEEK